MTKDKVLNLATTYKEGGSVSQWARDNGISYNYAMYIISQLRKKGANIPKRKSQNILIEAAKELK